MNNKMAKIKPVSQSRRINKDAILPKFDKNSKEEGTAMGKANMRYEDGSTMENEHLEVWVRILARGFVQELLEEKVECFLTGQRARGARLRAPR